MDNQKLTKLSELFQHQTTLSDQASAITLGSRTAMGPSRGAHRLGSFSGRLLLDAAPVLKYRAIVLFNGLRELVPA